MTGISIALAILTIILLLLFIPMKGKSYEKPLMSRHIDERDTMFSRNELKPGSDRYNEYYAMRPGNLEKDSQFRAKPGLLSEDTTYYNLMAFAAADASFEAVSAFFSMREKEGEKGGVSPSPSPSFKLRRSEVSEDGAEEEMKGRRGDNVRLAKFIKEWGKKLGAHSVGITEMKDYHYYTTGGRKERYGVPVSNEHKYGIAFTVEMDHELTATAPQGGAVMESARQYLNSGMIATQMALTLRNMGYQAKTHIDANYDVICPLVAKDAGLGEIGRMGLLMTPRLGPRVRIAVVTTDAPLVADKPFHSDQILDFCTVCKKCAAVCPSASIPFGDREEQEGGLRWKIDQVSCFSFWCQAGTDCGRCISVCPYSHKSNLPHNFVRWGISNNFLFRRLAVKLDDLFYGRKPKENKMPDWIDG